MRRSTDLHPVLAALAVTIRDNSVLLVRRRNPPDAGLWGYPGGKVDPGETVLAAAQRELGEETTVRATPQLVLDNLDVIGQGSEGQLAYHYHLVAVLCAYEAGTPLAQDDALEAGWHPIETVLAGRLEMSQDVDRVLKKALAATR